jgi:hypothetical protein
VKVSERLVGDYYDACFLPIQFSAIRRLSREGAIFFSFRGLWLGWRNGGIDRLSGLFRCFPVVGLSFSEVWRCKFEK